MSDASRPSSTSGASALASFSTGLLASLRGWPLRRWVATGVLVLPMAVLYASAGSARAWWDLPLTLVQALLAAMVVASYVPFPGSGERIAVGCTPCAAVAGMTVLGSLMMRQNNPLDAGMGLVSVLMLGYGVIKRITDAGTTCATR
jgi:hypothetical protein